MDVRLQVFDMLGREDAMLVNERKAAGTYTSIFDASGPSFEMYLYRTESGNFSPGKTLMLIE